jgi:hypothetical protein
MVLLGVLATGALSACQNEAGSAAFVGNTRITQQQVTDVVNKSKAGRTDENTQTALQSLIFIDLASRYAADHGIAEKPVSDQLVSEVAQFLKVDPSSDLAKDYATAYQWSQTLMDAAKPATVTDEQATDIYNRAVAAGALPAGGLSQNMGAIKGSSQVAKSITVRDELSKAAKDYGVSVNPRYAPSCSKTPCDGLFYPVLQIQNQQDGSLVPVVLLTFDDAAASPAVLDSPVPR